MLFLSRKKEIDVAQQENAPKHAARAYNMLAGKFYEKVRKIDTILHFTKVRSKTKGGNIMAKVADVIKYEGDNSTFIWKHPCEDFNTASQLIVHESQEAILFLNGQALDLFGPGRHTLETENIPVLRHLINIPTGGISAFHCEVYFINKTEQMAIRWGTDSKVQYVEPTYKFPISIGACGEMSLCVDDSRKLLVKLVGTERVLDRHQLTTYFAVS